MCLIIFAYNSHPKYKLVLAANRDEFFERPTGTAGFWQDYPNILGGRDIISGGTWMGITKEGRFAAITNYRNPDMVVPNAVSRGHLARRFLTGTIDSEDFLEHISLDKATFQGFNILVSDDGFSKLYHYSNITDKVSPISDGIHGLSNAILDTPWPKVTHGKEMLSSVLNERNFGTDMLIEMMHNPTEWSENDLPKTGISLELEKKLSPVFISLKGYGTRCTTVIRMDYEQNLEFLEVSYNETGRKAESKGYKMKLKDQK